MKKLISALLAVAMMAALLTGCGKEQSEASSGNVVNATSPLEVDPEALNGVSITLPQDMTRETVSDIQHDFIQDGKQVGGIVIVDIPNEMLESPYGYLLQISDLIGQQLMPDVDSDEIEFIGAGGNVYAYMEVYTGKGEDIRYYHYLLRGETYLYDIWFSYDEIDTEAASQILATVSSEDIIAELNKSPF